MNILLINGGTPDHVGLIPHMLDDEVLKPAREQLDANYQHGGGWRPMKNFKHLEGGLLQYPGDPPMEPRAIMRLRDEKIVVYDYGFVGIFQKDGSFEVARMD